MDDFRGMLRGNPISPGRVPPKKVAKKSRNPRTPGLCVAGAEGIPSCGSRKTLWATLILAFFDRCASALLASSSAGRARRRCPARGFGDNVEKRLNFNPSRMLQPLVGFLHSPFSEGDAFLMLARFFAGQKLRCIYKEQVVFPLAPTVPSITSVRLWTSDFARSIFDRCPQKQFPRFELIILPVFGD